MGIDGPRSYLEAAIVPRLNDVKTVGQAVVRRELILAIHGAVGIARREVPETAQLGSPERIIVQSKASMGR